MNLAKKRAELIERLQDAELAISDATKFVKAHRLTPELDVRISLVLCAALSLEDETSLRHDKDRGVDPFA